MKGTGKPRLLLLIRGRQNAMAISTIWSRMVQKAKAQLELTSSMKSGAARNNQREKWGNARDKLT